MLDWAKLLRDKIETTEEVCVSVDNMGAFIAIINDVVATFEVHDSVTDEELALVFAEIEAIRKAE